MLRANHRNMTPRSAWQRAGEQRRLAWQRRPSMLSRWGFCAYWLLIVDASLYPFSGWVEIGVGPFDYLEAPWPVHALGFDLLVNVLGYMPLGFVAIVALYPQARNLSAALLALVAASVTSLLMEATQTYLPTRVASKVDLLTNIAGAALGILAGLAVVEGLLDRGRLRQLRRSWFEPNAHRALLLTVLWFGAVMYPARYALGCGALFDEVLQQWPDLLDMSISISARWPTSPGWFEGADALVSGGYLLAALLVFLDAARPAAPRVLLLLGFVAATVLAKTLGAGFTYAEDQPLMWVTPGSIAGFSVAAMLATLLSIAPRGLRRCVIVAALCCALGLSNFGPDNTYLESVSHSWHRGRLLNFYGLALGISISWPLLALILNLLPGRASGSQSSRPTRLFRSSI